MGRELPADLARTPWLLREEGSGTRLATERLLADLGLGPAEAGAPEVLTLGSNDAIKQGLVVGLTLISRFAVARELRDGTLCEIGAAGTGRSPRRPGTEGQPGARRRPRRPARRGRPTGRCADCAGRWRPGGQPGGHRPDLLEVPGQVGVADRGADDREQVDQQAPGTPALASPGTARRRGRLPERQCRPGGPWVAA